MNLIVYIDGECPLCVAGALRFRKITPSDQVTFVNVHDAEWGERARNRFSGQEIRGSMRVEMPDGTWRVGWFAWAAIVETVPALKWLAWFMLWPIFYGIGPGFYGLIARNRKLISRLLKLPPPCDDTGVCRISQPVL